jgi:hypothetical protein
MKRIILLVLIFFNVMPNIKQGVFSITCTSFANAQGGGEGMGGEDPCYTAHPELGDFPVVLSDGTQCVETWWVDLCGHQIGNTWNSTTCPEILPPDNPTTTTVTVTRNCIIYTTVTITHTNGKPDEIIETQEADPECADEPPSTPTSGEEPPPPLYPDPIGGVQNGSGGTTGSSTYTLTSEDLAILNSIDVIKNEEQDRENNPTPCHGTRRIPGSTKFQQKATLAHLLIQEEYVRLNIGAEVEYYIPAVGSSYGYADIANPITGEIFEIKSTDPNQQALGAAEATAYATAAQINCPTGSIPWHAGLIFPPPGPTPTLVPSTMTLPNPMNPTEVIKVTRPLPGVLTYEFISINLQPLPVALPQSFTDAVNELMKRRRLIPAMAFSELALRYLRELKNANNPQLNNLLKQLKTDLYIAGSVVMVAYIAQAIITDGATLLSEAEVFEMAKDLFVVAAAI